MLDKNGEPAYLDSKGRPIKEVPKKELSDKAVKKITDVLHVMLNEKNTK